MAARNLIISLFTVAVAQDVAQLNEQLIAQKKVLAQAQRAGTYWHTLAATEERELKEVKRVEKYIQGRSANVGAKADATATTRLTACLDTCKKAQVGVEQLQIDNADLAAQVAQEQGHRLKANQTSHQSVAACEATAKVASDRVSERNEKLHKNVMALQEEHAKLNNSTTDMETERDALQKKLLQIQSAQAEKLAALKKQHASQLADMQKEDAKVLEAHAALEKTYKILQKQQTDLKHEEQRFRIENATEAQKVADSIKQCKTEISDSKLADAKKKQKQKEIQADALKEGAKQSDAKWAADVKNMTATKANLEAALKQAEENATSQEKNAHLVSKDVPDMELKLKRCNQSRAKTELDLKRVRERCPQAKA